LVLANRRNFKKVDVGLGTRVFVAGPNASGESNLLDAFRFLRDIAAPGGSLVRAVEDRRGLTHIRSLRAGGESNVVLSVGVTLEGDPDGWTYTLEMAGSETKRKPLRIVKEEVKHGGEEVLSRPRPDETDEAFLLRRTGSRSVRACPSDRSGTLWQASNTFT
jgi:predicted ATPase